MTISQHSWSALLQISLSLGQNLKPEVVFRRILDGLSVLIPNDVSTILLKEGDFLKVAAQRGFKQSLRDMELNFEIERHPRLRRALESSGTLRFLNPDEPDPFDDLVEGAEVLTGKMHSCMAAPLLLNSKPIGLITVDHLEEEQFAEEQENLLFFLGSFAALSIHHAQLIEALEKRRQNLETLNQNLFENLGQAHQTELIGSSRQMREIRRQIAVLGPSPANVLILGPTGSGKELAARALHAGSPRSKQPMIYVNCAAIPPSLAESELFGHTRGAFTGALGERKGKFEQANGGTLFLDEIGELPLNLQASLLRVLQEGEIQRVGSDKTLKVNVRVIAATNRDLIRMQQDGLFRTDLFHRLAVLTLNLPSLIQHREDIPELCEHYLNQLTRKYRKHFQLPARITEQIQQRSWPGGVRELFHTLESMAVWADAGNSQELFSLPDTPLNSDLPGPTFSPARDLKTATEEFQKNLIQQALQSSLGNQTQAAKALGLDPGNLIRKMKALGLK